MKLVFYKKILNQIIKDGIIQKAKHVNGLKIIKTQDVRNMDTYMKILVKLQMMHA